MGRAPCCEKAEVKKGPWSIHEDRILMNYIALHGHPNWRALPKQAGLKRCGKSCRLRWFNYLKPDIKRGNFTKEEEDAIINLHQLLGNKWSAIAARLPGRTDNEIKNVWHTHLKKRLIVINSNQHDDDDDDDDDDDHKEQQKQPPASSTETYASSSPDSGSADQASSSSSSSSSKSTVDDDDFGCTTFPEIDHTFLSQVLSDDQYSDFSTDPIFAPAAAKDQFSSSSSSSSSDRDDQFWYNLYTTAAAGDDHHYSLGHNLQDAITFVDSLIDLPLN